MKRLVPALMFFVRGSLFTGSVFAQAKPEDANKYRNK